MRSQKKTPNKPINDTCQDSVYRHNKNPRYGFEVPVHESRECQMVNHESTDDGGSDYVMEAGIAWSKCRVPS